MKLVCPVCESGEFDSYGGRVNARCKSCGALERGRLAWMIMKKLGVLKSGIRMLHMAPEPFMLFLGSEVIGDGYKATDYSPELFAKWQKPIEKLDMCTDLLSIPSESFDVVMHNHVLEHVPCNVSDVMAEINRLLAPGGLHIFSVPVMPGRATTEDLNPLLSPEERVRRFGQKDHLRIFGDEDFLDIVAKAMPLEKMVNVPKLFLQKELDRAALPKGVLKTVNAHRVFVWKK